MRLLIDGAMVWNGTGAPPFPGKVLVEESGSPLSLRNPKLLHPTAPNGSTPRGKFLMPGMVEGHAHLSFVDTPRGTALGELPPEDHTLLTMDAARKLLAAGFTSACSAAAAKIRLDVAVRDAIDQGLIDGPRLLAASPELTVTGGLGDGRKLHLHQDSFGMPSTGPTRCAAWRGSACAKASTRSSSTSRATSAPSRRPRGRGDDRRRGRGRRRGRARDRPAGCRPCARLGLR